jgi:hypothetical protein
MKPSLRFFRHGGIYRSDVAQKTMVTWGGAPPPVGRPPAAVKGRDGRNYAPCSSASSAMSSGRLFLDRVLASIARLRFTGKPILKPFRDRAQSVYSERLTVS